MVRMDFFTGALLAGLFVSVPQAVSNVYWISGRTDLLAFSLAITSTFFAVRYFTQKSTLDLCATGIFLILGLSAKETAILSAVYISMIYLLFFHRKRAKETFKDEIPLFILVFFIVSVYFILRYSIFGVFFTVNSSELQTAPESLISWIAGGILSVYLPSDPVDLFSIINFSESFFYSAVVLLITSFFLITRGFRNMTSDQRQLIIKFVFISFISLGVYIFTIPQLRLAYFTLPFSIGTVVLIFKYNKSLASAKILLSLYLLLVIASSASQVYKHITISKMQRQIEAVLDQNRMDKDTLFIVGQVGRIGQTWVSSSDAFLLPPSEVVKGSTRKTRELFYLPAFEGHVLTDLKNPYLIEFNADTLILTSNSLTSGFVPLPAYKYPQHGLYVQKGLKHKPVVFIPKRRGIAHKIKIYPLPHTDAPTVYYYNDSFRIEPFSEFRARFTSKGKPTNTE
ncbi:MAG: hypothetical protein HUU54_14350 [Ignavibacteriaceae bacterium]|nr:hypothetical protein [Ignavibacteriaceae bacterium]